MHYKTTLFLRIAVIIIGLPVIILCLWLPALANKAIQAESQLSSSQYPILVGLYATAVCFFFALSQTLKLLHLIDTNQAFSATSVKTLRRIKGSAIAIVSLYTIGTSLLCIATREILPSVATVWFVCSFAASVVAVFAAILQKLLQEALFMKSENDLTI